MHKKDTPSADLREYLERVYPSEIPPLNEVLKEAVDLLFYAGISLKKVDGNSAEFVSDTGTDRVTLLEMDDVISKNDVYLQLVFMLTKLGTAEKLIANFGASQEISERRSRVIYQGWTHIKWARAFNKHK